jgi:3-hydroxyacyl-[acyl-carrier-protein] dehydratase
MSANSLTEGLYRVISRSDEKVCIELADASHPVFKAHFEGNPILPGFLQLDIIAEILGKEIAEIGSAKFTKMVLPKMRIIYEIGEAKKGYRIVIRNDAGDMFSDFRVRLNSN